MTPDEAISAIVSRRSTFVLDKARLSDGLAKTSILQLAQPSEVTAHFPYLAARQIADGRSFIQYDPYVIESKFVGDEIEAYIPELELTVHGVIDNVEINGDIIRWEGDFVDFNSEQSSFSISQTMVDDYVIGMLETPMGSFNIEAKNGLGWIIKQGANSHSNTDDVITPL